MVIKIREVLITVIPAEAGIYLPASILDSGFRRNDKLVAFLDLLLNFKKNYRFNSKNWLIN